jgi:hypothetical protein
MQVQVKINQRTILTVEGDSAKECFAQLANLQQVFGVDKCGLCGSDRVAYSVREPKGFIYYELQCLACTARFAFGQTRESGALFPKTRDQDGNPKPNGGWEKYQKGSYE